MAYKNHEQALEYWRQYNAKRRKPNEKTARQLAIENKEDYYFTGLSCVNGHIDKRNTNTRICMACDREAKARARKENPLVAAYKRRQDYNKHKELRLAQKREYRQSNKGKIAALNAIRKKFIAQRTPKWVNKEEMWLVKEAYELAALRTKVFGFSWHVDHIIPLRGKKVSGLHVFNNLQVLVGTENIKKSNKFEVDHA